MTETANTSPAPIQSNEEQKKSERDPLELFRQYSVEQGSLTAKKRKGIVSNSKRARLRDLEERLIPSVVRRLNS